MISLPDGLRNRSQYLRTPTESISRQIRTFNLHAIEPLVRRLGLSPTTSVLNLGGGAGVLASHLASVLNKPENMVLAEPDDEYFQSNPPESLMYSMDITRKVIDPLNASISDNSFDRVLMYDFIRWFKEDEIRYLLEELGRLLTPEGKIVILETLSREAWTPGNMRFPDPEKERRNRFREIVSDVFPFKPPALREVSKLPGELEGSEWSLEQMGGWFEPVRLSDSCWTERQRTDLIDLQHKARRDRIHRVQRLLEETNQWEEDYGQLFRQLASDYQQQALRLRKARETDESTGWSGHKLMIVRVTQS